MDDTLRTSDPEPVLPRRIVVGLDDAGCSDDAVRAGVELAGRLGVPTEILHAVPPLPWSWPGVGAERSAEITRTLRERVTREVEARLAAILEPPRAAGNVETPPGGSIRGATAVAAPKRHLRIAEGPPAKLLLEEARKHAAWIVLGRHARREFPDFGNTQRAVFALASQPVWFQPCAAGPIRRILVPVDLSSESLAALATARELARVFQASVRCAHWFDVAAFGMAAAHGPAGLGPTFPPPEVREAERARFLEAMQRFAWGGVEHTTEFGDGDPALRTLASSGAADLVVLGAHGRTGLASVLLGGVVHRVLKRSEKPILVVRAPVRSFQFLTQPGDAA